MINSLKTQARPAAVPEVLLPQPRPQQKLAPLRPALVNTSTAVIS
jgi:hypothetical protein